MKKPVVKLVPTDPASSRRKKELLAMIRKADPEQLRLLHRFAEGLING